MNPLVLEFLVVGLGVLVLLVESFLGKGSRVPLAILAMLGLAGVFTSTLFIPVGPEVVTGPSAAFYAWDASAVFFKQLLLVTAVIVIAITLEYLPVLRRFLPTAHPNAGIGEMLALILLSTAGMMWMVSAKHFVMIFVSLELVTIALYILVAYQRRNLLSLEAGVKYLILGALTTGILVYGITWIYGVSGSMDLDVIGRAIRETSASNRQALLLGFGLVLVALFFKVGATPFHLWIPDVYQGAATPVTALLSIGSKAAGLAVLLRVLQTAFESPILLEEFTGALPWFAGMTLLVGNLAALPQNNAKRLLAYSSIAHAGFLLMAVASVEGGRSTGPAILFYFAAYVLMTGLAFYCLAIVSRETGSDEIAAFNGFARRSPLIGLAMTVSLLSLAGLPLTVGFLGKLFIFVAAIADGQVALCIIGTVAVGAGFYYYLKIVRALYWVAPADDSPVNMSPLTASFLVSVMVVILLLGILPGPLMSLVGF